MSQSISEIKALLAAKPTPEQLALWQQDSRKGVQKLLEAYRKQLAAREEEQQRLAKLMEPERQYWQQGLEYVAGCDEAGRGPLAGPLVTAAVILPHKIDLPGLNDSKQVTAKRREELYDEILQQAVAVTVSILGPGEIDELNIYQAAKKAMTLCLTNLTTKPQMALTDAMPLELPGLSVESLIHGDAKSAAIAAASIMAKVTRDRIMVRLDKEYPEYGFAGHKGYGSSKHMDAIAKFGATPWHRRSYEPLKSMHITTEAVRENKILKLK